LQEFYKWEEGKEEAAKYVLENVCRKLVHDMHYEARIQAVVTFYGEHKKLPMPKKKAWRKYLKKEEYMQVKYISACYCLNG
jgi:hypothetical protein